MARLEPNRTMRAGRPPRVDKPLTDAQRQLVADHYDVIAKAIRSAHFATNHVNGTRFDDTLYDLLTTALIRAACDWRPDGGASFRTYLWRCIQRKWTRAIPPHVEPLHWDIPDSPWPGIIERIDAQSLAPRALAALRPRQRELMTRLYYDDLSRDELAAEMGVSRQRIDNLHAEACIEMFRAVYKRPHRPKRKRP